MFNPNPAFLLVQKLKSAPRPCATQNTPNELCPTLVSLVFLHTFFCVAQSCKRRLNFYIYPIHKLKNGKKLKTLLQNNAVLIRAALSGTKPVPDKARQGVFSIWPRALHQESRGT
jgi:hypothetical protein